MGEGEPSPRLVTDRTSSLRRSRCPDLAWNLAHAFIVGWREPGWASLLGVVMILGGAQLMFIGLIGPYLARVFEEAKGRPVYLFKQTPRSPASRAQRA